jgi:hypothetical protein
MNKVMRSPASEAVRWLLDGLLQQPASGVLLILKWESKK